MLFWITCCKLKCCNGKLVLNNCYFTICKKDFIMYLNLSLFWSNWSLIIFIKLVLTFICSFYLSIILIWSYYSFPWFYNSWSKLKFHLEQNVIFLNQIILFFFLILLFTVTGLLPILIKLLNILINLLAILIKRFSILIKPFSD